MEKTLIVKLIAGERYFIDDDTTAEYVKTVNGVDYFAKLNSPKGWTGYHTGADGTVPFSTGDHYEKA